jgi:hypothetical protein
LFVTQGRAATAVVHRDQGRTIVSEAKQVLGIVHSRPGKPFGAGHPVDVLDDGVIAAAGNHAAKVPNGRPKRLRLVDRPLVERGIFLHGRMTSIGHEPHEGHEVRAGDLIGRRLPEKWSAAHSDPMSPSEGKHPVLSSGGCLSC